MQFRPSAQLLLYLRIDELANVSAYNTIVAGQSTAANAATLGSNNGAGGPVSPEDALALVEGQLDTLRQARGTTAPENYAINLRNLQAQRDVLLLGVVSGDVDNSRAWAILGVSPDLRYAKVGILPRQVEIERNGFRTADTASATIDWADVPFDPRILRAAAAEIVIGTVTDDEYQRGLAGERDPISGQLVSVVRQAPGMPLPTTTTRFVGWVDAWDVTFDETHETVKIELRDFTSLFLDTPLDSTYPLRLDLPLDEGIREMISHYPVVADLVVKYQSLRDGVATPAPTPARSLPPQQRSRSGTQATRGRTGDQRTNLWDVITDITVQNGLIPVVRGYEVHLIDPRVVYGNQTAVRRMVYGRNLTKLEFARKLGGTKVPTIEVRAYDPTIGRTRWARAPTRPGEPSSGVFGVRGGNPPRPLRANEITPGGRRLDDRIQTVILKNTTDPTQLARAASSLFQQIGRQEIEGNFETADVSSWDLAAGQPLPLDLADLLQIEAGDSVELLVQPRDPGEPDQVSITAGEWTAAERSARTSYLVARGMPQRVAAQFAALQDVVASTLFRITSANLSYTVDDGLKIRGEFINYIEIREDAANQPTVAEIAAAQGPAQSMVRVARRRRDPLSEAGRQASAARRAATTAAAAQGSMAFTQDEADAIETEILIRRNLAGRGGR